MIAFESIPEATDDEFLLQFLKLGTRVTFPRDHFVTKQYQRGTDFYLLESGELSVGARKSAEDETVTLGLINHEHAPIGWSAIIPPYRYSVDLSVVSNNASFLAFDIQLLMKRSQEDTHFGVSFFQFLLSRANHLIKESLKHLNAVAPAWNPPTHSVTDVFDELETESENLSDFLQNSPFFEAFEDKDLQSFASICKRRDYRPGDIISRQNQERDGFYLLKQGWVDFVFEDELGKKVLFRSISTPGFNISWVGLPSNKHYASAIARHTTSLYYFEREELGLILSRDRQLSFLFFKRMLWLINHQIQIIRVRFLTLTFDIEWIAVKTLIEANATRLSLDSELHGIPHLLKHKHSQKRAFEILHKMHSTGTIHEKHLASLALDNLQELGKEYQFYQGLIKVYQSVSQLPDECNSEDARAACAKAMIKAFEEVDYTIEGLEHLPENGGHIFIYNHLKNHPYNTLPNNFQVTLDSHFISAMVCFKKYQDAGLRVVRVGKDVEYGHQEYYEKLGHIDVYTSDSEERDQSKEQKEKARQSFYEQAGRYLSQGKNLIISPEGSSYETSESPGPLKSGAFRLSLAQQTEPLIIPVVIANFDKRVRYNQFRCKIYTPFKVSSFVKDPNNKSEMRVFLADYQTWYKKEVQNLAE